VPDAVTLQAFDIGIAWTVRGDVRHTPFVSETERALGLALPTQPGTTTGAGLTMGEKGVAFGQVLLALGPTSWLLVAASRGSAPDFDTSRKAINAAGGALFDVSASNVAWSISSENVERILNSACPLDLDLRSFPIGHCAQSLLGHVGALFYRAAKSAFIVMAARSFALDVHHDLQTFVNQSSTSTHVGA
jgi:heterotetrameric sarcosine oxidase gamma subunit